GRFMTIAAGLSYGGGQMVSGVLCHSKHNNKVIRELMENPAVTRVLGYGNSVFAFYFPKIYEEYAENMDALLEHHTTLMRPIHNTVFAAASFNFGPRAITYKHTDSGNKANGLCPIFCTGNFDPCKGGHLVMRQLKVVIEFPPGCLALIPSATLKHGNVSIQPGEQRQSFTQYAAGGFFRWVAYGFQPWRSLVENPEKHTRELERQDTRCDEALNQFSKVHELHEDRQRFFV
ncbi:hypothetical protein BC835DRAFT_1276167, partial [Cytidiella melzeri]